MASSPALFPRGTALFSYCGAYRYGLTRVLGNATGRRLLFLMLNPSSADHEQDDPTIRRCIGYANAWGFEVLEVANIFALRSTDPGALYGHADPVGPENDAHIESAVRRSDLVVAAWGANGLHLRRGELVATSVRSLKPIHALGFTKTGQPVHPLYQRADLKPIRWEAT